MQYLFLLLDKSQVPYHDTPARIFTVHLDTGQVAERADPLSSSHSG